MQLFYAPDFSSQSYTLSEEESKHCIRVLRLKEGDSLHITDGRGDLFCCRIVDAHPKRCEVEVVSTLYAYGKRPYRLAIAVAPTKNADRFEWFIEKATEVGIDEIIPLESEHSERRALKAERGEKIITAAMKQSLKTYRPVLRELTPFRQIVAEPFDGQKFIAHCDAPQSAAGKRFLQRVLKKKENALILIGPEGDFSAEEIGFALKNGFTEISLGSQRLRTETAAVAAAVLTAAVNEDDNEDDNEEVNEAVNEADNKAVNEAGRTE